MLTRRTMSPAAALRTDRADEGKAEEAREIDRRQAPLGEARASRPARAPGLRAKRQMSQRPQSKERDLERRAAAMRPVNFVGLAHEAANGNTILPSTIVVFTRPWSVWPSQGELLDLLLPRLGVVDPFLVGVEEADVGGGPGRERAGGKVEEPGGLARHQVDRVRKLEPVLRRTRTSSTTASAVSRPRMPFGA